jgi:hypothetical protein
MKRELRNHLEMQDEHRDANASNKHLTIALPPSRMIYQATIHDSYGGGPDTIGTAGTTIISPI